MPDSRIRDLEAQYEIQQEFLLDELRFRPFLLRPVNVDILMVTDGGGSFGRADFGLSALLHALATPPGPWVRFRVTTAHRRFDPNADLTGFRFDAVDLGSFDQIWMFALERSNSSIPLSNGELEAVSRFMDAGGGVFATGDHEDLGVAMCGRIPRVRNMRMWHWPSPGPNGEPIAPNVDGANRFDTLSAGRDDRVQFYDQSDDIPQTIVPRMYSISGWSHYLLGRARPHPVLCGPRGVIRKMPDHPHEGHCYVPSDLSASFTFGEYTIEEYPSGLAPEVIARSRVPAGRLSQDVKGLLNARTFGSIGAYDGHRVDVGRVVVDATWHHFFDINLIGALGNADPVKAVGFNYSTAGREALEDIASYFRNIAVWIASERMQRAMWLRAMWWVRWNHRIAMDLRPPFLTTEARLDLPELLRVGSEARDALGRVASQCTALQWINQYVIAAHIKRPWEELVPDIDPWWPRRPDVDPREKELNAPMADLTADVRADLLADAAMGAAVYGIAINFPILDEESRDRAEKSGLEEVIAEPVNIALRESADFFQSQAERDSRFGDLIR